MARFARLKNSQFLRQFVLTDVTPTGRILGTGVYGSVIEVKYKDENCAAKKLHEVPPDERDTKEQTVDVHTYQQECQLMSSLRHPNITQFLGLYFLPEARFPLLIMERLWINLDDVLCYVSSIPISLKMSLLEDVCCGLDYLHNNEPQVVHRNLTTKNVLLTSSLVAKISDLGNSIMVNLQPRQYARIDLSRLASTQVYMPPEALNYYSPCFDIFSFGHLALYTLIQVSPNSLLPGRYPDPKNRELMAERSEVERREVYMTRLKLLVHQTHPTLVQLVTKCLHNIPEERPSSEMLLREIQKLRMEHDSAYGCAAMNSLDKGKVQATVEIKLKDKRIEELENLQKRTDEQIQMMGIVDFDISGHLLEVLEQLKGKEEEIAKLREELKKKDQQLIVKENELKYQSGRIKSLSELKKVIKESLDHTKLADLEEYNDASDEFEVDLETKNSGKLAGQEDQPSGQMTEQHVHNTQEGKTPSSEKKLPSHAQKDLKKEVEGDYGRKSPERLTFKKIREMFAEAQGQGSSSDGPSFNAVGNTHRNMPHPHQASVPGTYQSTNFLKV